MNKKLLIAFRLIVSVTVLVAIVSQLLHGIDNNPNFNITNFLSFFTIESNIFGAIVMLVSAGFLAKNKWSSKLDNFRGAATLYMTVTGITYFLLLRGIEDQLQTPVPWINIVLHYAFPIAILIDWFISPISRKITFAKTLAWLSFPIAYVIYSLLRGLVVFWYPYPFLNPFEQGYPKVIVASIFIALITLVCALLIARNKNIIAENASNSLIGGKYFSC